MDTLDGRLPRLVAYLRMPGIPAEQATRTRTAIDEIAAAAGLTFADAVALVPVGLTYAQATSGISPSAPIDEMPAEPVICVHPAAAGEVSTFALADAETADSEPLATDLAELEPDETALDEGVSTSPRAARVAAVAEAVRTQPELSDRAIARLCGCSPTTAGRVRAKLAGSADELKPGDAAYP